MLPTPNNKRKIRFLVLALGVIMELMYLIFFMLNSESGSISLFMIIYFETFIVFFFSFYLIKKFLSKDEDNQLIPVENTPFENKLIKWFGSGKKDLDKLKLSLIIILFGIAFRITLIPTVPTTSPDSYSYIWDGKMTANGYNTYLVTPDDPHLTSWKDETYSKMHFTNMVSVYPPFSQAIFAASYLIFGETVTGLKIIYLICEIITMIFILKLLGLKKMDLLLIVLYAWLPLVILEFFVNAHLDIMGVMFFILFFYYIEKGNYLKSSVFFTLSFLIKFYPVFILPLLIKKLGVKRLVNFILVFILVSTAFYIPFLTKGLGIFTALRTYLSRWEFNGSIYRILQIAFNNSQPAHLWCGILFTISVIIISFRYKDFMKGVYGVSICYIAFATTLYPWYLSWISVINPFFGFYSVMSLLFTINFSNFTPLGPVWKEYSRVLIIEYMPFYFLLLYDLREPLMKRFKFISHIIN
jgi:alpha-1,6-mannosyltransferase